MREEIANLPYDEAREAAQLGCPTTSASPGAFASRAELVSSNTPSATASTAAIKDREQRRSFHRLHAKISARLVGLQDPHACARSSPTQFLPPRRRACAWRCNRAATFHRSCRARSSCSPSRGTRDARGLRRRTGLHRHGRFDRPDVSFDRILKIPQVMIGVGLPDDHIHAPNEKFNLSQFFGGIVTMTALYDELAKV